MVFEEIPSDPSLADPLPASPLPLLARWLSEARKGSGQRNPDAMTVATVDAEGVPRARVVLCRGYDADTGEFAFYTNRHSAKGRELAARPVATAVFHWDAMARQARITGAVRFAADAVSDAYFSRRPRASQIAAWASDQSAPLSSREALLERLADSAARFGGAEEGPPIPRPPHWGGYVLRAEHVELWVGSDGRAHDRAAWRRTVAVSDAEPPVEWSVTRLQP